MKPFGCLFLVISISGCSTYGVNTEQLEALSHHELCKALGENESLNEQGFDRNQIISRINSEINLRVSNQLIDNNECKAISEQTKNYELSRKRFKDSMDNSFKY